MTVIKFVLTSMTPISIGVLRVPLLISVSISFVSTAQSI